MSARDQHVPLLYDAAAAVPDPAGAAGVAGTPSRVMRQIIERRGQQAFRDGLLRAYGGRCAVTGCDIVDALEVRIPMMSAAGIVNSSGRGPRLRVEHGCPHLHAAIWTHVSCRHTRKASARARPY